MFFKDGGLPPVTGETMLSIGVISLVNVVPMDSLFEYSFVDDMVNPNEIYNYSERIDQPITDELAAEFAEQFDEQDTLIEKLSELDSNDISSREYWKPDEDNDPYGAFLHKCDIKQ
ncbi:MAG: hypothetical protein ABEI86_13790, partial [Halobacteriaceae archaeon]